MGEVGIRPLQDVSQPVLGESLDPTGNCSRSVPGLVLWASHDAFLIYGKSPGVLPKAFGGLLSESYLRFCAERIYVLQNMVGQDL
jgi:hypothetical protein